MNRTNLVEDWALLPLPQWWESPWVYAAAALAVAGAAWLAHWLWRRWKRAHPPRLIEPPLPDRTPEFLERLSQLRQRRGELSGYDLAIQCSDLLREFVEWRFRLSIRFQTTREFLESAARDSVLGDSHRDWLGAYLRFCDLVKFAQQGATDEEQTNLLDAAEKFIRQGAVGAAATSLAPAAISR